MPREAPEGLFEADQRHQDQTTAASQLCPAACACDVPVARQTLSQQIKAVLAEEGIDTQQFASHSTRTASCSVVANTGEALTTIMKAVGWSNKQTFTKFYKRTTRSNFRQMVLDDFMSKHKQ